MASPLAIFLSSTLLISFLCNTTPAFGCFSSIFGFGDSLTDAGNLIHLQTSNQVPHMYYPPYGETYFNRATGRCSDGRLIVDLIAEYYGLPIPPASLDVDASTNDARKGVNFAVVGSRAIYADFYEKRGIYDTVTNVSMGNQLHWFKQLLPSLCDSPSGCREMLQTSLILLGEFGGNDYTHSLLSGAGKDETRQFVPIVTSTIAQAVTDLIEHGAMTVMVPGILPIGCAASYLTDFQSSNKEDYDETGCLKYFNDFAEYHNDLLQKQLKRIRELHPHAAVIYADYYNAAMKLYRNPSKYGFSKSIVTCCGSGGPYNYNSAAKCGNPPAKGCEDPSVYINWDGYHLTEAAYRWITKFLLEGQYTVPPVKSLCRWKTAATESSIPYNLAQG